MKIINKNVIVVGGGPAGLSAAYKMSQLGVKDILVVEREAQLGGILRQCIHDGFGVTRFNETLSGPEYAQRYIDLIESTNVKVLCNATVLSLTSDKVVTIASIDGLKKYKANAIVLTMGCRERTRGNLAIAGERPTGVFTAGVAQAYMNLYNTMVGKNAIILGSGDIGLIMARRMTLEGMNVLGVFEIQPYPSGLSRNIEQCLNDFNIPLYLRHTVVEIHGKSRLESVDIAMLDENGKIIENTIKNYPCDTLILSVGLIPENELSLDAGIKLDPKTKGALVDENFQTNIEGIFASGNVLHVHDLVDFVSLESEQLAQGVIQYLNKTSHKCTIEVMAKNGIGHVLPQRISGYRDVTLSLRVNQPFKNVTIIVKQNGTTIKELKKRKMVPAEMMNVSLTNVVLDKSGKIEVYVDEN